MEFLSRRSPVLGIHGAVATSQPLASEIGLEILKNGGNAADAAVAIAAALNVTEPTSTGIGGDCFALYYDAKKKKVFGLNGSGRAPQDLSIDRLRDEGITGQLPPFSAHTVTVPGAAAGWVDTIDQFGSMELKEVLAPAIRLAEEGFPVSPITAFFWSRGMRQLLNGPHANELLLNGRAPQPGEIMKNPNLARTFRELAEHGKAGFYEGRIAEAIVEIVQQKGGLLTLEDLKNHETTFDDPINTTYKGIDVYEIPPNGQGITALVALNIIEELGLESFEHNSASYLHTLIEAMRIAFADTRWYVADPRHVKVPIEGLLSKKYARERRKLINPNKATLDVKKGSPFASSDTVYFCVVDAEGNACSFINSNYMGFGTGLIPKETGFTLQNRGANFSLDPDHPNALAPQKRPYHTIIPGMAVVHETGELWAPFGVMGGFMQPQGHVQVLVNMIDHHMDPQTALDKPRFCITDGTSGGKVAIEEGIPIRIMSELARMGHDIVPVSGLGRAIFGRGQIIQRNQATGVLWAGSDPRADGMAIAY